MFNKESKKFFVLGEREQYNAPQKQAPTSKMVTYIIVLKAQMGI